MASLLKIKPMMVVRDGEVVEESKVRSYRKAVSYLIEYVKARVGDKPVRMAVTYGGDPENALALKARVEESFNVTELSFMNLAIPIAVNMGPGALALFALPEE